MKYNYVILGSPWDLYLRAYRDVLNERDVHYKGVLTNNPILRIVAYFHLHPQINQIVNIPGKAMWSRILIRNRFDNKQNLCFIVFYDWICMEIDLLETIKTDFPNAKIVIIFNDLIKVKSYRFSRKPLDIESLRANTDLILSFDFQEAKDFNLEYHHVPYSLPHPNEYKLKNENISTDIYFIGQAKDRLKDILDVFYVLKGHGLNLKFILSNVGVNDRIYEPEIRYVDGIGISYFDNIVNVINTKCILEIIQKNSSGFTLRTLEALCYDKKLLTNNKNIIRAPFYNSKYISYFSSAISINEDFIKKIKQNEDVDYSYKDKISPYKLLDYIESKL